MRERSTIYYIGCLCAMVLHIAYFVAAMICEAGGGYDETTTKYLAFSILAYLFSDPWEEPR